MRRGDCVRRARYALVAGALTSLCLTTSTLRGEAPPQPEGIRAVAGALVICGGGPLPDQLHQRFLELAGGEQARIVIVPTASRLADTGEIESQLTYWRNQKLAALHILHTRSRDIANDPDFSSVLSEATGVWFLGGDQNKLTDAYLGTLTEQRLHELLRRGGVIGGTSAGAAIMSRVMIQGGRDEPQLGSGLGFLTGTVVDQHFLKRRRQNRLMKAVATQPGLIGLGIDESTAVVVQGTSVSVLGESQVCVCMPSPSAEEPPKIEMLKPGDQADLLVLCGAAAETDRPNKDAALGE